MVVEVEWLQGLGFRELRAFGFIVLTVRGTLNHELHSHVSKPTANPSRESKVIGRNIGVLRITYTVLGVP